MPARQIYLHMDKTWFTPLQTLASKRISLASDGQILAILCFGAVQATTNKQPATARFDNVALVPQGHDFGKHAQDVPLWI
jgi:hypothetical protein